MNADGLFRAGDPSGQALQDLGRLCLDSAAAQRDADLVGLSLAFLCDHPHGLERMAIFLFDEHYAPECQGYWPDDCGGQMMQLLDHCINNGAVAEAMHHGRFVCEVPGAGCACIRAFGTRGRDLGLFLGLVPGAEGSISRQLDDVLTPMLAMLAQSLDNLHLHAARQSHADVLQQAIDARTQELSLALQHSQAAERSKSIFLATMSHEIRTPMNGILGVLDLLAGDFDGGEHGELIATARGSAQHLLSLLNDILDLAKIDAGRTAARSSEFSLLDMVSGIIDALSSNVKVRSGTLRLELLSHLHGSPQRLGDPLHLRQILFNVCGNAVKFTTGGQVSIELSDGPGAQEGEGGGDHDWVTIRIRDSGIGISEEDQQHIFDPFQQAGNNRDGGGTGLGLAISHRLALLMGGCLQVESRLGEGSLFTIEVPLPVIAQPAAPLAPVVTESPADQSADETLLHGLHVLVAEDNAVNRVVIKRMLDRLGCCVVMAEDGERAWELYRGASAHLLLSDIEMPRLDGYGLAMRIREYEQQQGLSPLPIIALSAHTFSEHQQRATNSGFNGFIPKPVMLAELQAGIVAALRPTVD